MERSELEGHWPALLAENTQIRDRLLTAYDEPSRRYHNTAHLLDVLDHLEALMPADHLDRDAVVLAAWFHDAVYDGQEDAATGETDEERSALLAERELATVGLPPLLIDEVARLVRLTRTHDPAKDDLDGQLLCDADLAILASDPERYDAYVAQVREEYSHVSDESFRQGRKQILDSLSAAPLLFRTEAAARWEAPARANLTRELVSLASPQPRDLEA